jgi:hypothetical protein
MTGSGPWQAEYYLPEFHSYGANSKQITLPDAVLQLSEIQQIRGKYHVQAQSQWYALTDSLISGMRYQIYTEDIQGNSYAFQIDVINEKPISVIDLRSFYPGHDSTCFGYVFYPDLITSSQTGVWPPE